MNDAVGMDGAALRLPARKLIGTALEPVAQPHLLQPVARPGFSYANILAIQDDGQRRVLGGVEHGDEVAKVDLPQPLGPMMATHSPASTLWQT